MITLIHSQLQVDLDIHLMVGMMARQKLIILAHGNIQAIRHLLHIGQLLTIQSITP